MTLEGLHLQPRPLAMGKARQQIFFEDRLKDFANDRREADESELP